MRELSLFSGAGGSLLATKHLLGWRTIGYVENDGYCQRVLKARIDDGFLDAAPIFGDIRRFISEGYASEYQGLVDVVSAGFPCTPFSCAGKRAGEDDPRNMWPATIDAIRAVRPRFAFLENVPGLTARERLCLLVVEKVRQLSFLDKIFPFAGSGRIHRFLLKAFGRSYFARILGDLAELGYDARWGVLSAAAVGAPHLRKRLWIVCYFSHANRHSEPDGAIDGEVANLSGVARNPDCKIPEPKRDVSQGAAPEPTRGGGDVAHSPRLQRGRKEQRPQRERVGAGGQCPICEAGKNVCEFCVDEERGRQLRNAPNPNSEPPERPPEPREEQGRGLPQPAVDRMVDGLAAGMVRPWPPEPEGVPRVAVGVPDRVNRLKALGNGQVPICAAMAWRLLAEGFQK